MKPGYHLSAHKVIAIVAEVSGKSRDDILGRSRLPEVSDVRQLAAYIMVRHAGLSLPKIGRELGGRKHTTILHAQRAAEKRIAECAAFRNLHNLAAERIALAKGRAQAVGAIRMEPYVVAKKTRSNRTLSKPTMQEGEAKKRNCLMCREEFDSEWAGDRICRGCKQTETYKSGIADVEVEIRRGVES